MHANRWVGLGVGALALFFGAGLPFVDSQGGYAGLSPRFLPTLVTIGLALCSLVLLARPASVQAQADDTDTVLRPERSFHRLGWVGGGLVAHLIVIGTIGFVLSSCLLMVCVARGFGSTRPLRDAGIALAIAFPMWLLFAKVLQVSLKLFPLAGF